MRRDRFLWGFRDDSSWNDPGTHHAHHGGVRAGHARPGSHRIHGVAPAHSRERLRTGPYPNRARRNPHHLRIPHPVPDRGTHAGFPFRVRGDGLAGNGRRPDSGLGVLSGVPGDRTRRRRDRHAGGILHGGTLRPHHWRIHPPVRTIFGHRRHGGL